MKVRDGENRLEDLAFREWLVFFGLTSFGTAVIIAVEPAGTIASTTTAAAIVLGLQLVFWCVARPTLAGIHTDGPRAWIFAVAAVAGYTVAATLNPWTGFALVSLSPQIFLLFTRIPAAGVITALNVAPLCVHLSTAARITGSGLVQQVGTTAFIIAFSLFFAGRMRSVLKQNRERQQLIDELHEREAEVAALSAARGAEQERTRIAREMHDTLAQGFTSIITLGHAVQGELGTDPALARRHVELMTATAQENLAESRRIIAALSPLRLADGSLPQALERVVAGFIAETGVDAKLEVRGTTRAAPPATEVVVLRIVQEALANTRKHARAGRVAVAVDYTPGAVAVEIADDGAGFDTAGPTAGFGLVSMRSRVRESGGAIDVTSSPGTGTTVRATLPTGDTP